MAHSMETRKFFQKLQALNQAGLGKEAIRLMEQKIIQKAEQIRQSGSQPDRKDMADLQIAYNWIWWSADPKRTPQVVKQLLIDYVGECPQCGEPLMVMGGNAYGEDDTPLCDDDCKARWDEDHGYE